MKKPRIVFVLGVVGFLYSAVIGIAFFADAGGVALYCNIPSPASGVILLIRLLAILTLAIGLAYLFAVIYPSASRPLLMVATCDKVLALLYALMAFFSGKFNDQLLWDRFLAGWILDAILAIAGIYAVVVMRKPKAG